MTTPTFETPALTPEQAAALAAEEMAPQGPVDTQAKLEIQLAAEQSRLTEIQARIVAALAAGEDIGPHTVDYAATLAQSKQTQLLVNASAIEDEKSQLAGNIKMLIEASPLGTLLGLPVTSVVWTSEPGSGDNGPIIAVLLNQKLTRAGSTPRTPTTSTTPAEATGRSRVFFSVDGEILTGRDFVVKYASPASLSNSLVTAEGQAAGTGKWVTRPDFCIDAMAQSVKAGHPTFLCDKDGNAVDEPDSWAKWRPMVAA